MALVTNDQGFWTPAAAGGTNARSLTWTRASSTYGTFTPGSAPTSTYIQTLSMWIKRVNTGTQQRIFSTSPNAGSNVTEFTFLSGNQIYLQIGVSGGSRYMQTNATYTDTTSWHHWLVAMDVTQGTAANRLRLYYDGTEVVSFSTDQRSSITGTDDSGWNKNGVVQRMGTNFAASGDYGDYIADLVYFIDGQQLTPSSFYSAGSPVTYSGSYGTNGRFYSFEDNSNTTAGTMGLDSSGNGNNFTPTNFTTGMSTTDHP